jgi:hypothetical protein
LNLKCDEPLSNVAFNFNLRRYSEELAVYRAACAPAALRRDVLREWYGLTDNACHVFVSIHMLDPRFLS